MFCGFSKGGPNRRAKLNWLFLHINIAVDFSVQSVSFSRDSRVIESRTGGDKMDLRNGFLSSLLLLTVFASITAIGCSEEKAKERHPEADSKRAPVIDTAKPSELE